ncbi:MAG: sigma 54-interacting transcriptional regulator [Deltaproteobacteria bacterium]|nr:sigma 54-interacting transcriptional regulator [Deltaproteobacteria bacterium]
MSQHTQTRVSSGVLYTEGGTGDLKLRRFLVRVSTGPDRGKEILLEEGTLLVGSHPDNDFVLTDTTVSRYHLELRLLPSGIQARDHGSRNGTRFQGSKIEAIVMPPMGGALKLGDTELQIVPSDVAVPLPPSEADHFGDLLGKSLSMREAFAVLERVATSPSTVMLEGETGTGKELAARGLHDASQRAKAPFVVVDCSAANPNLLLAELFGHTAGAFTGADRERTGLIESSNGGTLFLDEIGELPVDLQPQLLRVLERHEVRRIGEATMRPVDFRLIAATNRDLDEEVKNGRFRTDLFYRIAVVRVRLPPLRERRDDIPMLIRHILSRSRSGAGTFEPSREMIGAMMAYDWPGNVRELRNVVERGLHLPIESLDGKRRSRTSSPDEVLHLPFKEAKGKLVDTFEREYLLHLLKRHGGNVSRAAEEAGIERNYVHRLMKKHGMGSKA